MSQCECKVCTDHKRWLAALDPQSAEAKAAFDEILTNLEGAQTDATYWHLKYKGEWPTYGNPCDAVQCNLKRVNTDTWVCGGCKAYFNFRGDVASKVEE